ncbi:MAG: DNA repair exonuclease [Candidatus Aenigmatarchaeota archaeon]
MADCHLGSWNSHPELKELPLEAFEIAIDESLKQKVDFILIAGDLFDTAVPPIDVIKFTVTQLNRCKLENVPVYVIAGSHDFSPTGKTMLSVLEEAELLTDLTLKDTETNSYLIKGMVGKKGSLEETLFDNDMRKDCENQISKTEKFKIFLFHSAVKEFSNPLMSSIPIKDLPACFDYYATGHVHKIIHEKIGESNIVFPGPTFPANFTELEELGCGGFYIVKYSPPDENVKQNTQLEYIPIKLCDTVLFEIDANNRTADEINSEIVRKLNTKLDGKIVLLKITGVLKTGRSSDINLKAISDIAKNNGARCLKKNIHITERDAREITTSSMVVEIENELIEKNIGHSKIFSKEQEKDILHKIMNILKEEKGEAEVKRVFEERLIENALKVIGV